MLVNVTPPVVGAVSICAVDLRLAYGVDLATQTVETITQRNGEPVWFTSTPVPDLAEENVRTGAFAALLLGWQFPPAYVATESATFLAQCAEGGPYNKRDVVVVAYGHDSSVIQTHRAQFSHAIFTARIA